MQNYRPQPPDSDCFTAISEDCIDCDATSSNPSTICGPDCPPLPVCDKADCKPYSYCDICEIDHSEFDLLGQPQSFWSSSSLEINDKNDLEVATETRQAVPSASRWNSSEPTIALTPAATPAAHQPHVQPEPSQSHDHAALFNKPLAPAPSLHQVPATHHHHTVTSIRPEQVPVLSSFGSIASFASPEVSIPTTPSTSSVAAQPRLRSTSHPPVSQCQWIDHSNTICHQIFNSPDDLHHHLKCHHHVANEPYCRWLSCKCGHQTSNPHRFAGGCLRHTFGHTFYRPYKCPICALGFAAADIRDEHVANVHFGQKLYVCDVPGCRHECAGLSNLRRHKQDKHAAEQFQCEFCKKNGKKRFFPRAQNLRRHFRTCKFVLAEFPEAHRVEGGGLCKDWFPPGYGSGHGGMNRAKVGVGRGRS